MDDLMQKLQSVLNDEESLNQIKQLAGMFSSGGSSNSSGGESAQSSPPPENNSSSQQQSSQTPDLSALLSALSSGGGPENDNPAPSQDSSEMPFDVEKLMALGSVMSQASKSDKNIDLLCALKPHLKEDKQEKIDKLIKIFKLIALWPALKESGVLGGDLFGIL